MRQYNPYAEYEANHKRTVASNRTKYPLRLSDPKRDPYGIGTLGVFYPGSFKLKNKVAKAPPVVGARNAVVRNPIPGRRMVPGGGGNPPGGLPMPSDPLDDFFNELSNVEDDLERKRLYLSEIRSLRRNIRRRRRRLWDFGDFHDNGYIPHGVFDESTNDEIAEDLREIRKMSDRLDEIQDLTVENYFKVLVVFLKILRGLKKLPKSSRTSEFARRMLESMRRVWDEVVEIVLEVFGGL